MTRGHDAAAEELACYPVPRPEGKGEHGVYGVEGDIGCREEGEREADGVGSYVGILDEVACSDVAYVTLVDYILVLV